MVKVFTTNKDGKIEFTQKELEKLLDEVWRDGYNSNSYRYWWSSPTITTPYYTTTTPYYTTTTDGAKTITYTTNTERNEE